MALLITFEEAATQIGQLPKLLPCPTATNIRVLVVALTERLGNIPSHQSGYYGFIGMFERADNYALSGADPWVDYADPGPHHSSIDGTITAVEQRDATELYRANKVVYNL